MDARLQHPFTCIVSGPSQIGKTFFIKKLLDLKEDMIHPTPKRIYYFYGIWNSDFINFKGVEFVQEMPEDLQDCLIVLDDLQSELNPKILNLFTRGSHHLKCSVILVLQNLFFKHPLMRNIHLNTHYYIIFKNPRDISQFGPFARHISPQNSKHAMEAYINAISQGPHSYLLVDLKPNSSELLRLRTRILPDEAPTIVYLPKNVG